MLRSVDLHCEVKTHWARFGGGQTQCKFKIGRAYSCLGRAAERWQQQYRSRDRAFVHSCSARCSALNSGLSENPCLVLGGTATQSHCFAYSTATCAFCQTSRFRDIASAVNSSGCCRCLSISFGRSERVHRQHARDIRRAHRVLGKQH